MNKFILLLATLLVGVHCFAGVDETLAKMESVAKTAQNDGKIAFSEFARAFYGQDYENIVRARIEKARTDHVHTLADYTGAAAEERIPVTPSKRSSGAADASYGQGAIVVHTPTGWNPEYLFHETGHHIQNENAIKATTDLIKRMRMPKAQVIALLNERYPKAYAQAREAAGYERPNDEIIRERQFLAYVLNAVEWEIRMQSLNRYWWLRTGKIIETPEDAHMAVNMIAVEKEQKYLRLARDASELPKIFSLFENAFDKKNRLTLENEFYKACVYHL